MGKRCGFCKKDIEESCVFEVCEFCGHKVWGEKMFKAIVENMERARDIGDLYQGSVSDSLAR